VTDAPADRAMSDEGKTLFEAMPQPGWLADVDGAIVYFNTCWYEYTGGTPAEMEGWGWLSVHDPAHLPAVVERWRAAVASGERFRMAFPLRRHDGLYRWFLTHASPIRDASGKVVRWVGIHADIDDERRERERADALTLAEMAARRDAEAIGARLAALTDLSLELSRAVTPEDVARVVVEQGAQRAGADTATLYALDESGDALELIAHRGVAPEVVSKIGRLTRADVNPRAFASIESGETLWAETAAQYLALFPELAALPSVGPRAKSFWSVPLVAQGRAVGLLGMGWFREQVFSQEERTFVQTFAKQCAQALLGAQRRRREVAARRWLATTLQSIGDAVIATDTEGRVSFMNGVAERLTGWSESDARGRPMQEVFRIFSEMTGEPVESPVTKVLREGRVVGLANHTVLRSRAGVDIPIDDSGAPIRDDEGHLYGVVLVFRDVTLEKRDEKRRAFLARAADALIASIDYKETLATVARLAVPQLADWCAIDLLEPGASKHVQVAVAHADPAKVVFARALGERYPADPNARTGVPEVIRSGRAELYTEIPAAMLEAGAVDAEHLRILRELALESAMVVPFPGRDGRTLGAMTFIYAASRRRYTHEDLAFARDFAVRAAMAIENARALKEIAEAREREETMRKEAELANTAKDEFLATVSHELRTPLNAILGWTVTLQRQPIEPTVGRALGVIERNARAQARLIDDVLDVSRIISGKLTLALGPVDVGEAARLAVDGMRPAAQAKGISLAIEALDGGHAMTIMADADRIQQILWNLLTNAIKFTPKGGAVSLRAERVGSEIAIAVSDTGEGIREEVLPYVFDPFRQADSSTTRRHGGLGLGLSLVKQLAIAHGGAVRATSAGEGKGATFIVQLPARAMTPALASPSKAASTNNSAAPLDVLPRLDGLVLLVVDDEQDARELVGDMFRALGAQVHLASSAADAHEIMKSAPPDVIVSDVGMPSVDGYAFIKSVRAKGPLDGGGTPAIALTAYSRPEDTQRALDAGFHRHVAKPVDPAELVKLVATLGGR
jgi:PAS domain S-box-containing protein